MEFDYPGPKPSYGIAGFSKDGKGVIAQSRYDLWLLPYGGGAAKNITNGMGSKDSIRLRYARLTQPDPMAPRAEREGRVIDLAKPVTLSAYGDWTKKSGFFELNGANLKPIVYEDAFYSTPVKALISRDAAIEVAGVDAGMEGHAVRTPTVTKTPRTSPTAAPTAVSVTASTRN